MMREGGFVFGFERLLAFQAGRRLVNRIYEVQRRFPPHERFALCDQIRRAAVSITSNIAEGMGRFSPKEQVHFIEIAFGSLMEIYSQLLIAFDERYIGEAELESLKLDISNVAKLLSGLRNSIIQRNIKG